MEHLTEILLKLPIFLNNKIVQIVILKTIKKINSQIYLNHIQNLNFNNLLIKRMLILKQP